MNLALGKEKCHDEIMVDQSMEDSSSTEDKRETLFKKSKIFVPIPVRPKRSEVDQSEIFAKMVQTSA